MAKSTLIIIGPGGIGKSPLDKIVRADVFRLDPYRLRPEGPRNKNDCLYANPKLQQELDDIFCEFGDTLIDKEADNEIVKWYPRAGVVFFTVRREWQFVIVKKDTGILAKMEIYAPVLPTLLTIDEFTDTLGTTKILILNPASESLLSMRNWTEIEKLTRINCEERGDEPASVKKRVNSVGVEAPYWRELINNHSAIEFTNWKFPEYIYKTNPNSLEDAKQILLDLDGSLGEFF